MVLDGLKKKFGKKLDEKKMVEWVNKTLEKENDMEQISKTLSKKYPKKEVENFLKKNYSVEPEVKDKKLEKGLAEEQKKKQEEDELDAEMAALKEEATGKGEETVTPDEVSEPETPKGTEEKGKEVPIQLMSTYHIELLNQVAGINEGIQNLIKILKK